MVRNVYGAEGRGDTEICSGNGSFVADEGRCSLHFVIRVRVVVRGLKKNGIHRSRDRRRSSSDQTVYIVRGIDDEVRVKKTVYIVRGIDDEVRVSCEFAGSTTKFE